MKDQWHDLLLEGTGTFDVPAWDDYRLEVYRGFFWEPGVERFALKAGESKTVVAEIRPIAPGRQEKWLSGDEHIHLMRAKEDDAVFLKWLRAEDLNVAMFLTACASSTSGCNTAGAGRGKARFRVFRSVRGRRHEANFTAIRCSSDKTT